MEIENFEFKRVDMGEHFGLSLDNYKWCQVYTLTDIKYPDGFRLDHNIVFNIFIESKGD